MPLKTNSKEYKDKVFAYLAESVYDFEGNTKEIAQHIRDRFESEFNYPYNVQRWPNLQERVGQWLAGLALNIAYMNGDILELAEQWAETTYNDKQAERIVENWFNFMAFKLIQFWNENEVTK